MKKLIERVLVIASVLVVFATSPAFGQNNDRWRQEQAAERARQAQAQAQAARDAQRARGDAAQEQRARQQTANDNARNARDRQAATSGSARGSSSYPSAPPTSRLTFTPRQGAGAAPTFNRAASPSQNFGKAVPPGTKFSSGGISNVARKPTPAEEKRGFTGRFSADGRALVKAHGRVYLVPASRIGVRVPQPSTSQATLSTKWSPQKQASISGEIQKLALGGGASGGGGAAQSSIATTFNASAVQGRIEYAKFAKKYPSRIDYSSRFDSELVNFNAGSKRVTGKTDKEMLLVQYHDGGAKVGEGRSLMWWTSTEQANSMSTVRAVKGKLALPWGERNSVSVARIPAGTEIEYIRGTASSQSSADHKIYTTGGGEQFMFKNFDPDWITETRRLPNE